MFTSEIYFKWHPNRKWGFDNLEILRKLSYSIKGQVQSPVKVCEVSEVATNVNTVRNIAESYAFKLYLKNDIALTIEYLHVI